MVGVKIEVKENMAKTIGHAVIGYGGMGHFHGRRCQSIPDLKLIGIYDIDPKVSAKAEEEGVHAYTSRAELLADERIDLVTVATPNDVHKEIVIDALRAGKNVICEKPVTLSSEDLEEMIAVANETGKLFTVHQNRRWDGDYLKVKHIFDSNTLGKIHTIEHRVHGSRGIPGDWRKEKIHGGGMVLDWGVHLLDQMLTMMGERKMLSVYAQCTNITNYECDDGFKAIIVFEGGIQWQIEVMTNNFIEMPLWYVCGENGTAVIKDWQGNGEIVMVSDWENRDSVPIKAGVGLTKTMAPRTDDTIKHYPLPDAKDDWDAYYLNIRDVLLNGAKPIVTHDQQRRLMKLIEAVFRSNELNEVIKPE